MARKRKKASPKTPRKKRTKAQSAPKEGKYLNLEYESFVELSCIYFAEELIKAGFVDRIERSPSYLLCDPVQHTYVEQLKRGSKSVTQTIQNGVSYTPDFDIYFTDKAIGKFIWVMGSTAKYEKNLLVAQNIGNLYRASLEVKPDFQRNSTTPKSVQSMKWLFQKHGIFINLFRPNRIFEGLFVPDKYKITERGSLRVMKFQVRNLHEYLKTLK